MHTMVKNITFLQITLFFLDERNRTGGSKVMGEKVMENIDFLSSIWDVFVQFLLNNSGNMNNRGKIEINLFVDN